jgi:hypothetical protein
VSRHLSVGIEGIDQDLEGLWDSAEADGGAKLLLGPSFHAQSADGRWGASITAGPVLQTLSTVSPVDIQRSAHTASGRHFGLFASASWVP